METGFCSPLCRKSEGDEVIHIDVQPAPGTSKESGSEGIGGSSGAEHSRPATPPNNKGIKMLQVYFRFLYFIFVSTFDEEMEVTRKVVLNILHWIIFGIFCSMALLFSLEQIKDSTIGYLEPGNIFNHVTLGFLILDGIICLLMSYIVVFKHGELSRLFSLYRDTAMSSNCSMKTMATLTPYIMAVSTILYGVGTSLFGVLPLNEWSPKALIVERAWQVSYTALFWSTETQNNGTIQNDHNEKFQNLTLANASLGIFGIGAELLSGIYRYASNSAILISSISMYYATSTLPVPSVAEGVVDFFKKKPSPKPKGKEAKKKAKLEKKKIKREEREMAEEIWKEYRHLRHLSLMLENAFGTLLRGIHIQYLLLSGHFLLENLYGRQKSFDFILLCVRILVVALTYFFAVKSSRQNKALRKWVLRQYKDKEVIVIDGERFSRAVILEDIAENPIGIGSGAFHIDDNFIMKFLTVIASYFLFIADQSLKKN